MDSAPIVPGTSARSIQEKSTVKIPPKPKVDSPDGPEGFDPVLVILEGLDHGTRVKLDKTEFVIGRGQSADLMILDDGISRKHLRVICINPDRAGNEKPEFHIEDLGSRNGTELNGKLIQGIAPLHERDRIHVGSSILGFFLHDEDETEREVALFEKASSDALTGLNNRHKFLESIERYIADSDVQGTDLCLAIIDIDQFKTFNDTHGHDVGDEALKHVAGIIRDIARTSDISARWGGEEFVIVFPRTSLVRAEKIAEQLREKIEGSPVPAAEARLAITVSQGLTLRGRAEKFEDWFKRVDRKLYEAKQGGRNRVAVDYPPNFQPGKLPDSFGETGALPRYQPRNERHE